VPSNNETSEQTSIDRARELGVDAETLWQAADKLRGSIDAAEYKHVVLGLIFLKYISDAFETRRQKITDELKAEGIAGKEAETLIENRDEYTAENVFWVPPEARWRNIQNQAKQPHIATLIDDAMYAIERDNPKLKGKLPARLRSPRNRDRAHGWSDRHDRLDRNRHGPSSRQGFTGPRLRVLPW